MLSCQLALMKENHALKSKERFYEGFNRDFVRMLDGEALAALERRTSAVHGLLRTEIAFRDRSSRM